ncbi:hypothetical protein BU15DRAFT_88721 [Melanogaster broomeanus]|nr:hypothetical protein BU15DRAFT_88721 [Melanogaster broomeanus]
MNTLPLPVTSLLHPFSTPRKFRLKHRTIVTFTLFALVSFTCYILFTSNPTLDASKSLRTHVQDHDRLHAYNQQSPDHQRSQDRKVHQHLQPVPISAPRPQISLSPSEELAALSAFLAALAHNVLPRTVDPNQSLDPQLVLDFDTRSEKAKEELHRVVEEVWTRYPVILFSKLHSADSREVRYMFSNLNLKPAPLVIQVDQREDADVLIPLLTRLTNVPSLPILLVGGQPVGSGMQDAKSLMTEIRRLYDGGLLVQRVLEAGAKIDIGKRRGGNRK